jgi:hypothetical protein
MSEQRLLTSDVGIAIRDALSLLGDGIFPASGGEPDVILDVDASDTNNLVLRTESGAQFTIRIVRTG